MPGPQPQNAPAGDEEKKRARDPTLAQIVDRDGGDRHRHGHEVGKLDERKPRGDEHEECRTRGQRPAVDVKPEDEQERAERREEPLGGHRADDDEADHPREDEDPR